MNCDCEGSDERFLGEIDGRGITSCGISHLCFDASVIFTLKEPGVSTLRTHAKIEVRNKELISQI